MRGPDSPGYRWTLARVVRGTFGVLLRMVFRVRLLGVENVPHGGAILAGNHVSYADPVLLWCASPRPTHFMAKSELWDVPFIRWALPRLWGFPVRRGEADRRAMRTASDLLASGELVGIFPEGTRHREPGFGEAHGGVAFLALLSGAPVVPVGIANTDRIRPRGARLIRFPRVTMSFGTPLRPEDYAHLGRKERVETMTEDLMNRIAAELARAKEA